MSHELSYLGSIENIEEVFNNLSINNVHISSVDVVVNKDHLSICNNLMDKNGFTDDEGLSEIEQNKKSFALVSKVLHSDPKNVPSFGRERGEPIAIINITHEFDKSFSIAVHHHKGTVFFQIIDIHDTKRLNDPEELAEMNSFPEAN